VSWYDRLAHPKTHLEAITSRPLLLNGVARLARHAGQSRLLLALTHVAGGQVKMMISRICKGLDFILANAPQLPKMERWPALVRYLIDKIFTARPKNQPIIDSPTFYLLSFSLQFGLKVGFRLNSLR
jgi:hypothetical protein